MSSNRKQQLFIFLLLFLVVGGGSYLYANRVRGINVILITIDALRPDHLSCYGYKRDTSPNIDKLAKEGVLFTQAISQAPWTAASLESLFTSTYPSTHKVESWGVVLDKRIFTLAEIMRKKNYYTLAASGGGRFYKEFPSFKRGFSFFIDVVETNEIVQQTLEWLEKLQNKKFFIWIHFLDYTHAPYLPPPPYNKLFISHETNRQVPIGKGFGIKGFIPDFVAINNITDIDYYISQYDGEIAYIDEQVGKILDKLRNLSLDKNTLIIISADHGESIDEHDFYFQHGYYLFDQLLKVPLIIKGPTIPEGKIINQQVQMIDITPSILSLLKINVNTTMEGTSLLPIIFGRVNNKIYAFSEICDGEGLDLKSIRTEEWKLIHNLNTNKYELYNLKNNPEETINLVEIQKEQFESLKTELEEWMDRPKPNIIPLTSSLEAETKKRLKSLGYLQ